MLATLDRGDTVLVPNPSYPIHIYGAIIAERHPLGADHSRDGLLRGAGARDPRILSEAADDGAGFPEQSDRAVVDLDFFRRVVELARAHDIYVVHDLAYADIVFDGYQAPSIMQVPGAREVAVEFFTLSKSYNHGGWRIGFMVGKPGPGGRAGAHQELHDYGTFPPIQVASIAALEGPQDCVAGICAQYQRRRDVLAKGLPGGRMAGRGAESFDVHMGRDSRAVPRGRIAGVRQEAAVAGRGRGVARRRFGEYGDTHVRFALIENEHRIRQAVRGIRDMLRRRLAGQGRGLTPESPAPL